MELLKVLILLALMFGAVIVVIYSLSLQRQAIRSQKTAMDQVSETTRSQETVMSDIKESIALQRESINLQKQLIRIAQQQLEELKKR